MNKFIFTKIFTIIGFILGIFAATNYGVKSVIEIAGYSLPYTLAGAAIGLILDLIQKIFTKK
jgi:hypothetical protein